MSKEERMNEMKIRFKRKDHWLPHLMENFDVSKMTEDYIELFTDYDLYEVLKELKGGMELKVSSTKENIKLSGLLYSQELIDLQNKKNFVLKKIENENLELMEKDKTDEFIEFDSFWTEVYLVDGVCEEFMEKFVLSEMPSLRLKEMFKAKGEK